MIIYLFLVYWLGDLAGQREEKVVKLELDWLMVIKFYVARK